MFAVIVCFCIFVYLKWFKGKKIFKNKYTDNTTCPYKNGY